MISMTELCLFFNAVAQRSQALNLDFLSLRLAHKDFSRFFESFDDIIHFDYEVIKVFTVLH